MWAFLYLETETFDETDPEHHSNPKSSYGYRKHFESPWICNTLTCNLKLWGSLWLGLTDYIIDRAWKNCSEYDHCFIHPFRALTIEFLDNPTKTCVTSSVTTTVLNMYHKGIVVYYNLGFQLPTLIRCCHMVEYVHCLIYDSVLHKIFSMQLANQLIYPFFCIYMYASPNGVHIAAESSLSPAFYETLSKTTIALH